MALLLSWNWFVSGDESNITVILPLTQSLLNLRSTHPPVSCCMLFTDHREMFVEGYLIFFPGPEFAKKGMRGGQVVMLFRDVP